MLCPEPAKQQVNLACGARNLRSKQVNLACCARNLKQQVNLAYCARNLKQQVNLAYCARNLRSRWQNKAWGASPRSAMQYTNRARETGGSAVARFAGSRSFINNDPGACAPGFMLTPASAG
jgi:hypothetical protein